MSGQLAKLFIRGSLVNVTAKNLTKEQNERVTELMNTVWADRSLDTAKHKFCNVLGCTISNEYKNKEFAMSEIWITIWRTAVDVLYHHPKPNVVENPDARRKYFKNCIYMYMKQILSENKIPSYRYERTISGKATKVASEIIQFYFDNMLVKPVIYTITQSKNGNTKFIVNVSSVRKDIMNKIWKLRNELRDFGVLIMITDNDITIAPNGTIKELVKKVSEKARVNFCSLSGFDDSDRNNFQQHCEHHAKKKREVELDTMLIQDSLEVLLSRLPSPAKEICEILVNTPQDFVDKYYPRAKKERRPKETQIAKYLGISKSEVSKAIELIKKQAVALDIN